MIEKRKNNVGDKVEKPILVKGKNFTPKQSQLDRHMDARVVSRQSVSSSA